MNRKTILVVEDDPNIRLGLEDNLDLEGYQVLSAADGVKGLKSALEKVFDPSITYEIKLSHIHDKPDHVEFEKHNRKA